ncbi:unnamed protein product [Cuscuta europaea]|uniref:Tify domain-containing protein n=1 Tax=Cuscuta europaea TaxID=41803 RepID=A0A9P0Z4Q0_CUSEU|nr:unnamed protein product [Cuscuta europaea]
MAYNNTNNSSKVEPKRSHQWFMDGIEPELHPNKKQDVDTTNNQSFTALLNSNILPWMNVSYLQSLPQQCSESLLDGGEIREPINYDDKNVMPIGFGTKSMPTMSMEGSYGYDSSIGLSIVAERMEHPSLSINYGGIGKAKDKLMPVTMGDNFSMGVDSIVSPAGAMASSMGLSFKRSSANMMSLGDTYHTEDSNFLSARQHLIGNNKINTGELIGSFKEKDYYMSNNQSFFNKDNFSIAALGQTFNRDDSNITSMSFNKTPNCFTTTAKVDNNNILMSRTFRRGEGHNIISFGGFDKDDDVAKVSGRPLSSYDLLMVQSLGEISENSSEKGLGQSNVDTLEDTSPTAALIGVADSKKDEQKANKKSSSNSFPSNVRSLLLTGIFDGVPVKYIAWSREELRGVIKDTGYLCGCQSCNFSKTINAYEFERHAGCKTKHPNNHIYFENGKTVYGIVQELRNTRQDLLFEVIQTISGSPVNQKSFHIWKESFLAATQKLQTIHAKGE